MRPGLLPRVRWRRAAVVAALSLLSAARLGAVTEYTYATDTTIASNTTLSGLITVNSGATLTVNNNAQLSNASNYDAYIGGRTGTTTGSLVLTGGGDLLDRIGYIGHTAGNTGAATVSGSGSTWTLSSNLYVGNSGTGTLTIDSGGSVSGAGTRVGYASGSNGSVTVTGSGSVLTASYLFLGNSGTGTLTLASGGKATISNTSNYLNLGTGVAGNGTLNIGAASAAAAASAGILDTSRVDTASGTGTVQFNTTGTSLAPTYFTKTGASDGTGIALTGATHLVHTAGYTVFTGDLTHTGSTTISGGTVQIGAGGTAGSLSGNITNNAALVFARSDALSYSGVVSGTGSVTQAGTGTLTLTGTHTFTGATSITAGAIKLNGSAANSAFTLGGGGILSGSGTVGSLTIGSGATLAPGNSPGTLNAGNTTFASGGSFEFEINNATGSAGTNYDLLAITGSLTIAATSGSPFTLDLTSLTLANTAGLADNFDSAADYSFTFLTTTTGITGFSADKFSIDTTGFTNPFSGTWAVAQTNGGNDLALTYTGASAIPEPGTYAITAGLVMFAVVVIRRKLRLACRVEARSA